MAQHQLQNGNQHAFPPTIGVIQTAGEARMEEKTKTQNGELYGEPARRCHAIIRTTRVMSSTIAAHYRRLHSQVQNDLTDFASDAGVASRCSCLGSSSTQPPSRQVRTARSRSRLHHVVQFVRVHHGGQSVCEFTSSPRCHHCVGFCARQGSPFRGDSNMRRGPKGKRHPTFEGPGEATNEARGRTKNTSATTVQQQ